MKLNDMIIGGKLKMGKKTNKDKRGRLHLNLNQDILQNLRNLKKEKKIKNIIQFAAEAINEKLNPVKSSIKEETYNKLNEDYDRQNKQLNDLRDESKYYHERKQVKVFDSYSEFLESNRDGIMEFATVSGFPIAGWVISILFFWIIFPIWYLSIKDKVYYVKTEKEIE